MNDDKGQEKIKLLQNLLKDASDTIQELQKHLRTDSLDAAYASKEANGLIKKIKSEIEVQKNSGCLVLLTTLFFVVVLACIFLFQAY